MTRTAYRQYSNPSPKVRSSSRQSSCATCAAISAATQSFVSDGRSFIRSRIPRPNRSSDRLDDASELVEYLANLIFAHDQRRTERQRVADGAEGKIILEKAHFKRIHSASSDGVGPAGQIDAHHQPHGPDVEHVWQTFEAHCCAGPALLELACALEQTLFPVKIERCKACGTG